jgi:hypothetical protein
MDFGRGMNSSQFFVPLDTTNILESFGKGNFYSENERGFLSLNGR